MLFRSDDLGIESKNINYLSYLFTILYERNNNEKSTIISTNLGLKEINEYYGRETPLLVGAPLALCLTLAAAATATTVVARRPDLRMLERLGMPQWQRAGALARSVVVDTLCAGAVAAVVSMGLLALTIRPYAALIGIGTTDRKSVV